MSALRTKDWLSTVTAFILLMLPGAARAQHTWTWPLYERGEIADTDIKDIEQVCDTGMFPTPRPAVWTSHGEWQEGYLHPGADFMGNIGDVVVVPASGTIERVYNNSNSCLDGGYYCRIWIRTDDERYRYYFSHLTISETVVEGQKATISQVRPQLQNAMYRPEENRHVDQGCVLATLTSMGLWNHTHFGVNDGAANYDSVDPISLVEQQPRGLVITDDEPPAVLEIDYVQDTTNNLAWTQGECGREVSGDVDVIANMLDAFYSDGDLHEFTAMDYIAWAGGTNQTGIAAAQLVIRRLENESVESIFWYDLAQVPMFCPGPHKGTDCEQRITDADFYATIPGDGAPKTGLGLYNLLYLGARNNKAQKAYWHVLTNSQGVEGAWHTNSSEYPDGRYQVSVIASDFAGNKASRSEFVVVHNTTEDFKQKAGFRDAYIKDHDTDIGAMPSNLGGEVFWASPDIFVVPHGEIVVEDSVSKQVPVVAGTPYDVWVRVRNDACMSVPGVKVRVSSADPSVLTTMEDWTTITEYTAKVADVDHPDGVDYPDGYEVPAFSKAVFGPFHWTPTEAEAGYNGHRCLLASITAPDDLTPPEQQWDAAGFNNVGQRNLQLSSYFCMMNPGTSVQLELRAVGFPFERGMVKLVATYDDAVYDAWSSAAPLGATVSKEGDSIVVTYTESGGKLSAIDVGPNGLPIGMELIAVAQAEPQTHSVSLVPWLNGDEQPGCTFQMTEAIQQ